MKESELYGIYSPSGSSSCGVHEHYNKKQFDANDGIKKRRRAEKKKKTKLRNKNPATYNHEQD
ncbi:conserved hypothetical protein [Ricinus communis]|uniref:Uncharacterized protein n=1 Tax=Ricinus communis TaxID=3988 RepID=B9RQJ2_RICCO|nr:conserved hypothetical protein [Ricinus communis]